ncbi:hypothetical protein fugu_000891 [Takifugu bimaculatus]|uniref:Uncharacterized protein n=1 Tax=Takifugu bimaculatus TaxID=433685 RepID=A0A4Z2CI10_9TELE|nr:hypothetical protein fugu_000891 [Takifugu bimaculatus]
MVQCVLEVPLDVLKDLTFTFSLAASSCGLYNSCNYHQCISCNYHHPITCNYHQYISCNYHHPITCNYHQYINWKYHHPITCNYHQYINWKYHHPITCNYHQYINWKYHHPITCNYHQYINWKYHHPITCNYHQYINWKYHHPITCNYHQYINWNSRHHSASNQSSQRSRQAEAAIASVQIIFGQTATINKDGVVNQLKNCNELHNCEKWNIYRLLKNLLIFFSVSCPLGYSGFNCGENWELVLLIVGPVLGGLLLITLILLITVAVRSKKHRKASSTADIGTPFISHQSTKAPLINGSKGVPAVAGVPSIPRATAHNSPYSSTNLEMIPSNSQQNLITNGRNSRHHEDYGQSRPQNNPYSQIRPVSSSYTPNQGIVNPYYKNDSR